MSRVIAITGASAGIGRATALRLARDGASIAILARRSDRLNSVAEEVANAGARALPVVGDVTREADMDMFVEKTIDKFGRLDVMMCNAGFGIYGAIDEITPDQMKKLMDVNYFGTYYAARAALRVFRRQQLGHIIIVSSIAGKRGVPYMSAYSATKFAQIGMAECLRAEVCGSDIHVASVPSRRRRNSPGHGARDGGGLNRTFGPKQPVEEVAEAVARAIENPIPEIYPYFKSRGLVVLNAIAPGFTDKIVQKFGRKPRV